MDSSPQILTCLIHNHLYFYIFNVLMALLSRALKAFVMVAEELHFGRAAQRLHMSQPPLSQQIRQFEEAVGAQLLTRTTRSVQLTPAGRLMLERARQMLRDADSVVNTVQRVSRGEAGSLTLGFSHSTVYRVLPLALKTYRAIYPNVKLDLQQMTSDHLADGILSGRIDLALLRLSPTMMATELVISVVAHDPMVLVMPSEHPLAAVSMVPVQALNELPFISYDPVGARYFHELIESVFTAGGVRPTITHVSILPTMLALVESGMGVALVPSSMVTMHQSSLVSRPLSGIGDTGMAKLWSAWQRDNTNPAVRAFANILPSATLAVPV